MTRSLRGPRGAGRCKANLLEEGYGRADEEYPDRVLLILARPRSGGNGVRAWTTTRDRRRLLQLFADRGQGAGQQPRDMHLGNADLVGDLLLGAALEEPHLQDSPVTLVEAADDRGEHEPGLGG